MSNVYTFTSHRRPTIHRLVDAPLTRVEGIHREWGLF